MSVSVFQRSVLYIKEVQDIGLFTAMTDSRLFQAFGASPLYYIMLPMIGLLLTVLAVINGYQLAKASNRNFDKWSDFIVSAVCAVLASISLYGGTLSTFLGLTFAAGPWFFISSVILAFSHQTLMLGINIFRAFESLAGSSQRMHYIQAALNNLFILGLLASVIGAVTFVLLLPIAPVVASVFAITAVVLTVANIVWRLLPTNWKHSIKEAIGLGKPEVSEPEQILTPDTVAKATHDFNDVKTHHRIFTRCDYSAQVKALTREDGEKYLQDLIKKKILVLNDSSEKSLQKASLLEKLSTAISGKVSVSKPQLLEEFPLGFQSFWSEKGDVEQIVDAALIVQSKVSCSLVACNRESLQI